MRRLFSEESFTRWLLLGFGVWLLAPNDTFAGSPTYHAMATVAPEWAWGASAVVIALVWAVGRGRMIFCFLAVLFWLFVVLGFGRANFWSTGTVTYSIIALQTCKLFLKGRTQ